jgi:hypothetical protein
MSAVSSGLSIGEVFILVLPYFMALGLLLGITFRSLIFHTVKRHEFFVKEFEKRVNISLESDKAASPSFYLESKRLLEKTYYEIFEIRDRMKRRQYDKVASLSDRVFMIRQGSAWLIKDLMKQIRYLRWDQKPPNLLNMTKASFHQNPYFNRLLGLFPMTTTADLTAILPSMFIVGGILGTFIGIAKGLPELGGMNLSDVENSRLIMDRFLNEVAFAMQASITGIFSSIVMNLINTWLSPEKLYVSINDRFENSLELLWYRSRHNDFSSFEGDSYSSDSVLNRDSGELLAEEILNLDILKNPRGREYDAPKKNKAS